MTLANIPNRKKIPELGAVSEFNITNPEKIVFPNNMEANIIRAGKEEITRIDVVFEAGSSFQNKRLVAGSINNLLKEGTSSKNSMAIAGILDYYGAYLNTQVNKDTASVTLYALTKHLDNLLPLMGELISDSVFPEEELAIYLDRQKQDFLVNIEKVRFKASLEFNKMIFGENTAYGQVLTLEDFEKINRDDIVEFYKNHYKPEKAYVILSGNIDDNVISLTEKHLGNLTSNSTDKAQQDIIFTDNTKETEKYIEKADALQSALRVGKQVISKTHPDFPAFQLLNTILGGYFGSRLMSNLREDKGYTYGIYSQIQSYKHATYFSINAEVNADHTNAAMDEICKEIDLLRTRLIGKEELQLVKNYLYGSFLKSFDGPLALAERFRAVNDSGLDFSYYTQSLKSIMRLTEIQLLETANKYFQKESLLHLVIGKR